MGLAYCWLVPVDGWPCRLIQLLLAGANERVAVPAYCWLVPVNGWPCRLIHLLLAGADERVAVPAYCWLVPVNGWPCRLIAGWYRVAAGTVQRTYSKLAKEKHPARTSTSCFYPCSESL